MSLSTKNSKVFMNYLTGNYLTKYWYISHKQSENYESSVAEQTVNNMLGESCSIRHGSGLRIKRLYYKTKLIVFHKISVIYQQIVTVTYLNSFRMKANFKYTNHYSQP